MHLSTLVMGSDHYSAVQKKHSRVLLTILSKPPTFLAPGTSIMEDSLFKDREWGDSLGMIQEYYIVSFISVMITSVPPPIIRC